MIDQLPNFPVPDEQLEQPIDKQRYTRITRFFARMILHIIMWDLVGGRLFLIKGKVKSNRPERYRKLARQFRELAVEMGGVMIKLGQFLSSRVDVLPMEIIQELAGLQDEVPPVPNDEIAAAIRTELGDPLLRFAEIETEPLAAASFGQTHRAWLKTDTDERGAAVVVKVQRPNIELTVRTDLAALRVVAKWMMNYRPIRTRADAPALMEEFAVILWEELDYVSEAENASRFADIFDSYAGMYVPKFYREHCTERVLVIENVESLKVTDVAAMTAAGIDSTQVADRLLDVYFQQVFEEAYFHADPHPGNIFIRPRPDKPHAEDAPTPFDIIFIDFGMMGKIPDEMHSLLGKMLVSITTRDSTGLTDAYAKMGFFLPGADLERISEAQSHILDQIWGRGLLDLANPDMNEVQELGREFKDILFEFPFQIPQNFIYLGRALGILSGISSVLNPAINPWSYIEKYGQRLVTSDQFRDIGLNTAIETLREYADLPLRIKRIVDLAESGQLSVNFKPDRQTSQKLLKLEQHSRQLNTSILASATLVSGTMLFLKGERSMGKLFWAVTGAITSWSAWRNK